MGKPNTPVLSLDQGKEPTAKDRTGVGGCRERMDAWCKRRASRTLLALQFFWFRAPVPACLPAFPKKSNYSIRHSAACHFRGKARCVAPLLLLLREEEEAAVVVVCDSGRVRPE